MIGPLQLVVIGFDEDKYARDIILEIKKLRKEKIGHRYKNRLVLHRAYHVPTVRRHLAQKPKRYLLELFLIIIFSNISFVFF